MLLSLCVSLQIVKVITTILPADSGSSKAILRWFFTVAKHIEDFSSCYVSTTFATEIAMLDAISGRFCYNQYLKIMNESIMQEFHKWGSMYKKNFGYVFVTCASEKNSEDILTELKTHFTNKYTVDLDGKEFDLEDNLVDISSIGNDISMQFDLNKVLEEDNEILEDHQRQDDIHVTKMCFNLNKNPWYGDDISDSVRRESHRFLTEYFSPSQYDIGEKF
ncbi:hypothetical protein Ahy_A06g030823 [Arachis hypogaea]|uniref:Oxo-4-hydroxy-4-carboxy-5-ureidoimidazoline decarboxylase domain-containing protein n=1 Tax=Arachis hypogaea TaxID=3818 RepID=A0A445CXI9_ARAHY|nr:hypothetical protein Ahy_A06g030823 [Arachis hypogaea]